jgi:parvulin-like peptidyl-prolyl isomerase
MLSKQKQPPWDLGFLKWSQVPKSWRPQIDQLKDGEISDVIPGPKKRFWLVKLVKRQVNNDITFAQVKPALMELIKGTKTDELREQTNKQLRSKAAIKYLRDPATVKLTAPPSSEK